MKVPRVRTRLIALAVGVVLVVGSTVVVVRSNLEADSGHGIGGAIVSLFHPVGNPVPLDPMWWRPWIATAWTWSDRVEVRDVGDLSGIDLAHALNESGRQVIRWQDIYVQHARYPRGLWGAVRERELLGVIMNTGACVDSPDEDFSKAEREAALRILDQQLVRSPHPDVPFFWVDNALVSTGNSERSRVQWSGYLINAATIVGLGLIGWGSVGAFVAVRAQRRTGKHQCVRCRYDLRGLAVDVCPECGTEVGCATSTPSGCAE